MTTYTITKAEVLDAIDHEPLRARGWVARTDLDTIGDCAVCAVGAVLRRALKFTNRQIHRRAPNFTRGYYTASSHAEVESQIRKENWLGALSMFFEYQWEGRPGFASEDGSHYNATETLRARTRAFVEERFPESFTVSDGRKEASHGS